MPDALADLGWSWITAAVGVVLVATMIKFVRMIWRRRRTWTLTEATVGKVRTRQASSSGGDGGTYVNYHYTDWTGHKRMGVDEPFFRKPKRNSKVLVRYDPESPGMSEVVMPLWAELAIATGIGAVGAALVWFSFTGVFNA